MSEGAAHPPKHKKHAPHGAHAEHEHEEGWIVSFADNVLLMMGFFVILLAMNMGPKGTSDGAPSESAEDRLLDVAIAVREGFNNPVSLDSSDEADKPLIRRMRHRLAKSDANPPSFDDKGRQVQNVRPTDWAGDGAFVQFAAKEALLDQAARETIEQIANRQHGTRWIIEIRGHASKWETWRNVKTGRDLSYQRAWVVGEELVRHGIAWDQIRLVASGDTTPAIARARTADEAKTNQRTEILILNEVVPPDMYNGAPDRTNDGG
jgi:flagellar motor protein MotB